MKKLYKMSAEEQFFAEKHYNLINKFLRINHLPEDVYFDVVVFGFIEAVQKQFRAPIEEERQNFEALARICMEAAINNERRYNNAKKRRGETLSLDYIVSYAEDDDFSLYEILFDERQDVVRLVEARDLLERTHARGTRRELEVMDLIACGYDVRDAAKIMGVSENKCDKLLRSIRRKTETVKSERESIDQPRPKRKPRMPCKRTHNAHRRVLRAEWRRKGAPNG